MDFVGRTTICYCLARNTKLPLNIDSITRLQPLDYSHCKQKMQIEFLSYKMQTAWQIYVLFFFTHCSKNIYSRTIAASSKSAWQKTLAKGPVPRGCSTKALSSPVTSMWGWVWSCWTKYGIPKLPMLPQVWLRPQPRLPCHLMRPRLQLWMTMKEALHKMCQDELPPGLPGIKRKQPQKLTVSKITKTIIENSHIQHCKQSELRLHFEWTKVH